MIKALDSVPSEMKEQGHPREAMRNFPSRPCEGRLSRFPTPRHLSVQSSLGSGPTSFPLTDKFLFSGLSASVKHCPMDWI